MEIERVEGIDYFFEQSQFDELPEVRALAVKIAFARGGQTMPIAECDIDEAREQITGEVNRIRKLEATIATLTAERDAARAGLAKD